MSKSPYPPAFYAAETAPSSRSASHVVPFLISQYHPTSVVDVGCGLGHWAAAFRAHGVEDVVGIDGPSVPVDRLVIPRASYEVWDLERAYRPSRRFDLAVCLEVGEHLPAEAAAVLVRSLVELSDIVVFSAAIPGQGGQHHINEQWQSYWAALFAAHGYAPVDVVRRSLWRNEQVEPYYLQNCLVYRPESLVVAEGRPDFLDVVHPRLFLEANHAEHMSPRALARALPRAARRTIRRRLAARRHA